MKKHKGSPNRSFDDLLAACKLRWVHPDFTERRFPLEPIAEDEAEWELRVAEVQVNGEEGFRRLKKAQDEGKIRPCGLRRAMEYVSLTTFPLNSILNYLTIPPTVALIVPVVAQNSHGVICVPVFSRMSRLSYIDECVLDLQSVSHDINRSYHWLVLLKRKKFYDPSDFNSETLLF